MLSTHVSLKHKKGIVITDVFQKILKESGRIWMDKSSEFCIKTLKWGLPDNMIKMYSMYNEQKSLVAERFIRTLKNKIYKYMTSISKNVYVDKLGEKV